MQFPKIKSVAPIEKYKLFVAFSNSTQGEYDVSHLASKGVFLSRDLDNNFFKVSVNPETGAISWPGDLDIDTINAYCKIKGIEVNEYLKTTVQHAAY